MLHLRGPKRSRAGGETEDERSTTIYPQSLSELETELELQQAELSIRTLPGCTSLKRTSPHTVQARGLTL